MLPLDRERLDLGVKAFSACSTSSELFLTTLAESLGGTGAPSGTSMRSLLALGLSPALREEKYLGGGFIVSELRCNSLFAILFLSLQNKLTDMRGTGWNRRD